MLTKQKMMLRKLIQTRKEKASLVHIAKNNKRKRDQNRSPFLFQNTLLLKACLTSSSGVTVSEL